VKKACALATSMDISPRLVLTPTHGVSQLLFTDQDETELPGLESPNDVLLPLEENPRSKAIAKKSRSGLDEQGKPQKATKAVTFGEALFETILHHFYNDSRVIAYGEENRDWGGAFAVYQGMTEALPYNRLFNSPISEAAIVGAACGAALMGMKPVAEFQFIDFISCGFDLLTNYAAKSRYRWGGSIPAVFRGPCGSGVRSGPFHSLNPESFFLNTAGLKIVEQATAYDANGLIKAAIRDPDPVLYFENNKLYLLQLLREEIQEEDYNVEIGKARTAREGRDVSIITFGAQVLTALDAAEELEKEGLDVEVIDLRTLAPLDKEAILASVRKTSRALILH
jgi:2-oxoisovalerate dehydrogenase E1 component beta subunit